LKKGDLIDLEIEKYAFEGKGIAKIEKVLTGEENNNKKYVVFVDGSYPGDKVKAEIKKIKKSYAEAKRRQIISPSTFRTKPKCKFFGECGGCKQQDLDYRQQIKFKQQQVQEIFEKMGGFRNLVIENIIPSEKIFYYRNKMEFSFSNNRWLTTEEINSGKELKKDFALGLHVPQNYEKVLDIDECFLQSEISNQILNFTRNFFVGKQASVYSTKNNEGFLRNLVIKQPVHSKDLMVNLVTLGENVELLNDYSDSMIKSFPQISTIVNNINLKKAAVAIGDYEKIYYGDGFIFDSIGNFKFRISANSFFQTNTLQAEKLYQTAMEFAEPNKNEIIYDLYAGTGTISIYFSGNAKEIYSFESIDSAIKDGEENLRINKIDNIKFFLTDLNKSFINICIENKIPKPDTIILDPPRSGVHKNTIKDIIELNPKKIIYVSCNPTTQTRDVKLLTDTGYNLIKMKPVDMFPHTFHIENVALLIKQ
jgi:23S rRNA (uracil1939-C5)-methyltransferase